MGRARSPDSSRENPRARRRDLLAKPHQAAFVAHKPFVDVIKLLDQGIDARLVQTQRLHLGNDFFLELLVFALLRRRQRLVLELELDVLILQAAQPLVGISNGVEGLQHLGLQLRFDRGQRERVLEIVVIHLAYADRRLAGGFAILVVALGNKRGGCSRSGRWRGHLRRLRRRARHDGAILARRASRRHPLGVGTRIGRFEIDDIAQEDLSFVELVAPDDDRLEGERAFAQPGNHRLAASLDALGDGDLALAREQLHRAHVAQIHANGIVRAPEFGSLASDLAGTFC